MAIDRSSPRVKDDGSSKRLEGEVAATCGAGDGVTGTFEEDVVPAAGPAGAAGVSGFVEAPVGVAGGASLDDEAAGGWALGFSKS